MPIPSQSNSVSRSFIAGPHPSSTPQHQSTRSSAQASSSSSSSSQPASTGRTKRSLYADLLGKDFLVRPKVTPTGSEGLLDAVVTDHGNDSSSSQIPASSPSVSRYPGTASLLDKAASSPQLGSPERKNGRFDWHNNPSPEMVERERRLAAEDKIFVLPASSPTRHRKTPSAATMLLASPRRARFHSHGSGPTTFLPNGHPASSLAQGLGITAPRTPRSRQASALGRQVMNAPLGAEVEQDQDERDRVASTLAMMAESRHAGSDSSGSGSDRPRTPPPLLMPSTPRKDGFAHPESITPVRGHRRNVSWTSSRDVPQRAKTPEDEGAAAMYLLHFANSPSPAGATRSQARFEGSTPTHSLRATDDDLVSSGKRKLRSPPITPPPSGRSKHQKRIDGEHASVMPPDGLPQTPPAAVYGMDLQAPKTPPPLIHPSTPQAPGTDFSYADFVNVSPSPNPRSIRRTPRGPPTGADKTPSRGSASRARFLDYNDEWHTLTPGPSPRPRSTSNAGSQSHHHQQ